jgi:protein-L-isoaspartate(D-aspartate) O-methyltransferase
MIIPVGPTGGTQELTLVTKEDGEVSKRQLAPVRFVPFLDEEP